MLGFNEAQFNKCAFNAEDECHVPARFWELFLLVGAVKTFIARGADLLIPPNLMFPGQVYQLERTDDVLVSVFQFRTPPAITFDELGG